VLECWFAALKGKTNARKLRRAPWDAGGAPVTSRAGGGVFAAQYRDRFGCRYGASPSGSLHSATVARGSAERVAKRSGYGAQERLNFYMGAPCAPVPPRLSTPSAAPCSLPRPIRYCAANIRLGARLAPVTPPAFPTPQFGKRWARKRNVCRFAGEHDAGGSRRRWESRRTSRVNRTSLAACNVAGRSPEKTAFRVACWQRRRAPRI
jgi:hypothetical protein